MNKILVIAAHPDDELLGCGGTVALHKLNGDDVVFVIVCEGDSLRYDNASTFHQDQIYSAAKILGVSQVHSLKYPDQKLETILLTDLIQSLIDIISEYKPNIIYTQYGGDINRDHKILFEAVQVASRPTEKYIDTIYAFDTASSTEWAFPRNFIPDTWVDISKTLDTKLKAMQCYKSELRDYPHPRSIKALQYKAYAWGNQVLVDAAEVFMTIRKIVRNK